MVHLLYANLGVILFAIGNSVGVALNPGADYEINRHDYGLVLADNVQVRGEGGRDLASPGLRPHIGPNLRPQRPTLFSQPYPTLPNPNPNV